ncbi:MAG: serine protease [Steroidobacteraceae bacterium]
MLAHISDAILAAELHRRLRLGLPGAGAIASLETSDLASEWDRRGFRLEHAVWFGATDNRKDPFYTPGIQTGVLRHAARCCYLIGESALRFTADGAVELQYQPYGNYFQLCADERFWCQPTVLERRGGGYGSTGYSGYLLEDNVILSCWHGYALFEQERSFAVFGYAARRYCDRPLRLPAEQVIALCPQPLAQPEVDRRRDAASDVVLLELERPAPTGIDKHRVPHGRMSAGEPVYTLGFPCGLPMKLADGARVLSVDRDAALFRADLDTYDGNSGSPVFSANDHRLLGIVLAAQQGAGDFEAVPSQGCYRSNRIDRHALGQVCLDVAVVATLLAETE